eukprot:1279439-Rhodomonas_salina.1
MTAGALDKAHGFLEAVGVYESPSQYKSVRSPGTTCGCFRAVGTELVPAYARPRRCAVLSERMVLGWYQSAVLTERWYYGGVLTYSMVLRAEDVPQADIEPEFVKSVSSGGLSRAGTNLRYWLVLIAKVWSYQESLRLTRESSVPMQQLEEAEGIGLVLILYRHSRVLVEPSTDIVPA